MKNFNILRKVFTLALVLIPFCNINSQTRQDIFTRTGSKILWLGLDFTQVRIIGSLGTVDKDELVPLFDDINRVVVTEKTKYNLEAALRKDEIPYNLNLVRKLNSEIDPDRVISYESNDENSRLNEETISVLVKQYNVEEAEGIGLIFFVESLNKHSEKGTMWVTFFSLADRNVLFTERMAGQAGGISFRNHWARSVFEVVDQIRTSRYAEWRFRYAN